MQTKEIFSIRKFKTGTHSARIAKLGIALAATAVLGAAGVVSADETSAATEPKTVATEQPLDVTVDNSKAEQAAQEAKSAGVNVVKDQTKDLGTATSAEEVAQKQAQAQQEQAEKAKEITATKEQYLAEKEAVKTENAARDTRNEELKKAADEAKKSYDNANKDIKTDQDKVKSEFPDAKIKESTAETKVSDKTYVQAYKDYQKQVEAAQTENKKAVDTYVEEKRKEDKAIADAKAYNEAVRKRNKDGQAAVDAENAAITKRNEAGKKAVDTENTKITQANKEAAAWNASEKKRFESEMAQAESDKNKDGHLSKVYSQSLVYKSEPNAHKQIVRSDGKGLYDTYDRGAKVTVTYTNLQNSSYAGTKLSKVEYEYESLLDGTTLDLYDDPTVTVYIKRPNIRGGSSVRFKASFYDDKGKLITFSKERPGIFALNSLNRTKGIVGTGGGEGVKDWSSNLEFVPISGSVVINDNGFIHARNYTDYKENGSRFPSHPASGSDAWDTVDSPNRWYGAGAFVATSGSEIAFTIHLDVQQGMGDNDANYYFGFNSDVASPVITRPNYKDPAPLKTFTPEKLKTFTPEKEKAVPTPKAELKLLKVTPPTDPTFEPHLKDPKTPTVHYNDYKLKVKPTVTPEKHNHDKDRNVIDGASMLPGSVNYYTSKWHKAPYKGVNVAGETVKKHHAFIEDYDEDKVEPIFKDFTVIDAEGKKVSGLKMYHVLSGTKLSEELQKAVEASGIKPKGSYIMWVAEDAVAHAVAYNQAGKDIYFRTPMKNKTFVGEYKNQVAQIDYNNGYWSNVVVNHIPKLENKKDVVKAVGDTESLNGKEIKLGQTFWYLLDGAKVSANRGEALFEYKTVDDYDQRGDEFTGNVQVLATTDIVLKDGTIIKKGTNLTQYTTLTHDKKNGIVTIDFKADFLATVSNKSEFDADTYLEMKRIASGTFENTQKQYINGVEVVSNTVKTTTPETEKPKTPEKPHEPVRKLPQTGEKASAGLLVAGVAILSMLGLGKFKRKEEVK
ncbi:TPA: LPXTG cell wall anchor domain-containing protein [Streptococcus pyogenes]|nr:LPXTG cell wall anchor domain-containing protein [Streptococcus pyogenes]